MVKMMKQQTERSRAERGANPKTNTKPSVTDTGNTRKHIPRKSIESVKNIEISQVTKVIAMSMKSDGQMFPAVGIIVANIDMQIETINDNPQTGSCSSGNRNRISGEKSVDMTIVEPVY